MRVIFTVFHKVYFKTRGWLQTMNQPYGLYVTAEKDGRIKRKLVTKSGTETVDFVSVKDELINFSARDMRTYLYFMKETEKCADAITEAIYENNGEINMDHFDAFLKEVNIFLESLKPEPVIQTLMQAFLEDSVQEDDGSAMFICEAMPEIQYCIQELYAFKIVLDNIFLDYMKDGKIDGGRYPFMSHSEFKTIHLLDGTVQTQYLFRAPVKYYVFLLMQFLSENPVIARCENCGNFFVPKTRKKTLYCDRIIADGKTCKQVAPKQKHKQLAESDPVIEAYDRTQRKMYKRLDRAADMPFQNVRYMDYEMYDNWMRTAQNAKKDYIAGNLTAEEALEIIEVND